jgi:hypothetical protein
MKKENKPAAMILPTYLSQLHSKPTSTNDAVIIPLQTGQDQFSGV